MLKYKNREIGKDGICFRAYQKSAFIKHTGGSAIAWARLAAFLS